MDTLIRSAWAWELLAFALGGIITWSLLTRTTRARSATARLAVAPPTAVQPVGAGSPPHSATEDEEKLVASAVTTAESRPADVPPPAETGSSGAGTDAVREPAAQAGGLVDARPPESPEPVVGDAGYSRRMECAEDEAGLGYSRRMESAEGGEHLSIDDPGTSPTTPADAVPEEFPPGPYGPGSADAVPYQLPPDGFTIKATTESMLFHTPDSPYYGRTKPQVWFRTESDATQAGFTKYVRTPRRPRPTTV